MDEQPDTVSFGSQRHAETEPGAPGQARWMRWTRGRAILAAAVLLGGLGTAAGVFVTHQDSTIHDLRTALGHARGPGPAATDTALPVESGSAVYAVPDVTGGSLSMVAAAIRPRPGSAALTWLYIYDRHATPGERYGLLEGTCGGQYVTATDMADGTANQAGDLTIDAPNLDIDARSADVWVLVYRWSDGLTLGGVQGPLIGSGARTFRSEPPC
jgi:hypothetical protein